MTPRVTPLGPNNLTITLSLNNPLSTIFLFTTLPLIKSPTALIEAFAGPTTGTVAVSGGPGASAWDEGYAVGSDRSLSGYGDSGGGWDWHTSFSAAQEYVDGLDDHHRSSLDVLHGLVAVLCHPAVATGASLDRALRLAAYEFTNDAPTHRHAPRESSLHSFSSLSGGGVGRASQPYPETWGAILEASVRVHQDEELRQTLAIVEERCTHHLRNHHSSSNKATSSSSDSSSSSSSSSTTPLSSTSSVVSNSPHQHPHHMTVELARARLRCYARWVGLWMLLQCGLIVCLFVCLFVFLSPN